VVTKTSVWVGMLSWCELAFGLSVWMCAWATADGESSSSTVVFLKQLSHFGYKSGL
jgi:type IV secretory pathway TrbD component